MQGQIVAIVAADSEDRAEDAVDVIDLEYVDLPSVADIATARSREAPDLREGKGSLLEFPSDHPNYRPLASGIWRTAMWKRVSLSQRSCVNSPNISAAVALFRCSPSAKSPPGTGTA
jgi:CO/xanthine dehydrogenase Mo-binding subunit